ncbi:MAG: metallophosphoesterase [Bacteroidia bacterium]|nr:metallophosphoesterase [Bacteroidia bacterium]
MKRKNLLLLITVLILTACGTVKTPYYGDKALDWQNEQSTSGKSVIHTLYLLGDAGEVDNSATGQNYVLEAASKALELENKESTLVFLGDNIYPAGLPNKEDPSRKASEQKLNIQLDLAKSFEGNTYFIPGNHDWNKYKPGGRKAIRRQEDYIEAYFPDLEDKKVKMYPSKGCGDPKVVKVSSDLVFVFLDTQWWLQDWDKEKKMNRGCDVKSRGDLLESVEEIFTDHKNDEIVVFMHHPIKSNGLHGGNFNLAHHIFPLHEKNFWFPLPVIGSIYPIFRQLTGSKQDITNVKNQELVYGIEEIAKRVNVNTTFASGHEHGLQFFREGKRNYVISGAGSKHTYTKRGGKAEYARDARGYSRVLFYEDSEAWVEFYTVSGFGKKPVLEYRSMLRAPKPGSIEEEVEYTPVKIESITMPASEDFKASKFKQKVFGEQYRDIWGTPVEAEVIDLEKAMGGLTPVKKGGGMASNSLRMQADDGKQYNLRSIQKDYTKLVPDGFGNLKILDILKDQNSASHPYGAMAIPTLSKAAEVYYTQPKLVYLKHQRGLGNYNSQFPEELYLLEERPNGDWTGFDQFGGSSNIIGYADLLEILRVKKNHFIDQEWVLKSRLFDLFIHDWDRHDDQWRWAQFEEEDKTIYRPIPRDRDQVFYKCVGIVPSYVAAFVLRKFKTMKEDVRDVKYLSFNARYFDRYFLNELDWKQWEMIVQQLQENITDSIIEESMQDFPQEVLALSDDEDIARKLKARKRNLMGIAKKLYDFISKEVEVTGTDDKDRFEIEKSSNGSVKVQVYVLRDKKGDILKYERTFYPNETKEIRLYGLRGKDKFIIKGAANSAIRIRIIGGEDDDELDNQTSSGKVLAYDNLDGIEIKGNARDKRSDHIDVNEYDREGFKYNASFPLVYFGFTKDDGFWFGASMAWTNHGWRKDPYKAKQSLSFSIAPASENAIRIGYDGHFPDLIDHVDFAPSITLDFPQIENYFGLGNETTNPLRERQFNWVSLESYEVSPLLQIDLGQHSFLKFGPTLESHKIKNIDGRVGEDNMIGFTPDELKRRSYLGLRLFNQVGFIDNEVFPTSGIRFSTSYSYLNELSLDEKVSQFNTEMQFYVQLIARPKLVLANNVGYRQSWGDQQFYQYVDLGNLTYLRGFRNNRFRGESAFFHNVDLRLHLFQWNNSLLPMDVGILGGYDHGRVWVDDEDSDTWQNSTSIGLWFNILGSMVLQPYYSFVDEKDEISFKIGFNF